MEEKRIIEREGKKGEKLGNYELEKENDKKKRKEIKKGERRKDGDKSWLSYGK